MYVHLYVCVVEPNAEAANEAEPTADDSAAVTEPEVDHLFDVVRCHPFMILLLLMWSCLIDMLFY